MKESAAFAAERQRIAEGLRHAGASDCSSLKPLMGQSLERLARDIHERGVVFRVPPPLTVSVEEVELVRESAQASLDSFAYPKGTPDHKQPTEWHEGRKLMALAERLAAYRAARP
jgi:hypothetical protein